MGASTIVLVVVSPINLILNIALIHYTPLGLLGSPVALSITYWLCFIFLAVWTCFSPRHKQNKTWGGLQPRLVFNVRSCWQFLKLALPGILMVGTEWYARLSKFEGTIKYLRRFPRAAFEIVALAAGRLGAISLAAQSVIMTTDQSNTTQTFDSNAEFNIFCSLEHYSIWHRCCGFDACR